MQYELLPTNTDPVLTYEHQLWQARYSPDGGYLIACGYDASLQRWDLRGGEPNQMPPLRGHNGWVQCFNCLPTEPRLISADSWGQLTCWPYVEEVPTPVWSLPEAHDGWIRSLAVSPDGQSVATGGNGASVRIWSTADGTLQQELAHSLRVYSLCFHPDGGALVSGDLAGAIRHWDLATGKVVRQLDASQFYSHDVAAERIQHCGGARWLAFDTTGRRLACAGQLNPEGGFARGTPCVIVFDWETGATIREMPMGGTEDGFAYDAQFHPDGFVMATSSAFPGKGHVWFWRPDEEQAAYSTNKLANGRSLSLHPDGRRVAFLSSDSRNANGRPLKDGEYEGGRGIIRLMTLTAVPNESGVPGG